MLSRLAVIMLPHISSFVLSKLTQPAWGLLVPAAQATLTHLHKVEFASNSKQTPPYLKDAKKEQTKTPKTAKAAKVPRALGAYTFFVKEQAAARKGEAKASEMMKILGQEWKQLSTQQKKPYEDMAARSKAEVAEAREKAKADRPPLSAYNIWCSEVCKDLKLQNPSMKATDMMKEAAARWKALPANEKDRRTADANAAKEAWKQQRITQ